MFYNIQALRGIAALLVVMHHALPHFKAMNLSNIVFETIGRFGYIGVDVFFVISGFVMAKTSVGKTPSIGNSANFLAKRFLRIFLGFWPIFGLALLYYYNFDSRYIETKNILQSFFLVSANMHSLVISQAWSLTYELYFYMIVAMLLVSKFFKAKVLFSILILFVIIKYNWIGLGNNKYLDFFFSSLLIEFISGYFLFCFLEKLSNRKFLFFVILLAGFSLGLGMYLNIGYGYIRVLTFGVFAFSLVWLFLLLEINKIIVFKGLLKRIGDASYTLYLSHAVLLGMFYTVGLRDYLVIIDSALIGMFFLLLSMVALSMLFYKWIELPLYQFAKKKLLT